MAYLLDDDTDELLDQQKKQQQQAPQPQGQPPASPTAAIGKPISVAGAGSVGTPITPPASQPPPEQGVQPTMPMPAQAMPSIGTPITPSPAAPRPAGEALAKGMEPGGKLAPPDYAGKPWMKALDIMGAGTKIGQAIETGAGIGTMGHQANLSRAEQAAEAENKQITSGEQERATNASLETKPALTQAQTGLDVARTAATQKGTEDVEVTLPDGSKATVPRSAVGGIVKGTITQQGQDERQNQRMAAAQPLLDAREKLVQAQTELAKFRADPNNPQALRAQQMLGLAQQRYELSLKEFEYNYDPSGLSPGESAMLPHDEGGGAIPLKSPQAPTSQTRTRGQMAAVTEADEKETFSQIDRLAAKIGPGAGRWNQFWVNKAGINDPDFANLDSKLHAYASGLAVTHFGARGGGQQFIKQMEKEMGEAQSPEDLKARIQAWDSKMSQYAKAAGVQQTQQHQGGGKDLGPAPQGAQEGQTGKFNGVPSKIVNGRIIGQ